MSHRLHARLHQFPISAVLRSALLAALIAPFTVMTSGCGSLPPAENVPLTFYSLDNPPSTRNQVTQTTVAEQSAQLTTLTLLVNPTIAASGFDSQRIIYTRVDHQLEYFARSEWIDTPARMIGPMIVDTLANSSAFSAVIAVTSAAAGDLRLNTEIVRLQHDFGTQPSQVHFTLRAYVLDNATRRVLASHEFDEVVPATSDAPYDGIIAANHAVQSGLSELTAFCVDTARQWEADRNKAKLTTP